MLTWHGTADRLGSGESLPCSWEILMLTWHGTADRLGSGESLPYSWEILMLTWHGTAQAGEWGIPPLQLGDPNADMARYGTGWGVGNPSPTVGRS